MCVYVCVCVLVCAFFSSAIVPIQSIGVYVGCAVYEMWFQALMCIHFGILGLVDFELLRALHHFFGALLTQCGVGRA